MNSLAQTLLADPRIYRVPASLPWLELGLTHYHEPREPRRMSAFSAALAHANADAAFQAAEARARRAAMYDEALADLVGWHVPRPVPGGTCGYLRYPILVEDETTRARLHERYRMSGVATSYPMPLPHLPVLRQQQDRARSDGAFAGAVRLARGLVTLPTYSSSDPLLAHRIRQSIRMDLMKC